MTVNVDLDIVLNTLLNVTELENLEQGIEKLRRAPEKDLEKMASETLPGMTPSPAVRAYLEEMEVQFSFSFFLNLRSLSFKVEQLISKMFRVLLLVQGEDYTFNVPYNVLYRFIHPSIIHAFSEFFFYFFRFFEIEDSDGQAS